MIIDPIIDTPEMLMIRHNLLVKSYNKGNVHVLPLIDNIEQKYAYVTGNLMYLADDFEDIR